MPRRSACCSHAATISTSSELPCCAKAVGRESGQGDAPHAVEDDGVPLLHQNLNPLRRVDVRPHFLRQHGPVLRPAQLLELGLAERRDDGARELRGARHDHERGVAGVDGVQVRDGVVEALPRDGGVVFREERHVLLRSRCGQVWWCHGGATVVGW